MTRAILPLFPNDDGWPYPDAGTEPFTGARAATDVDPVDLDQLELRAGPHAWDGLDDRQRLALTRRFGFDGGAPASMRDLAAELGCTRSEAATVLGSAVDLMRQRLTEQ